MSSFVRPKAHVLALSLILSYLLVLPLCGQSILTRIFTGTGFVVSSDGYILTNRHVVEGATYISVTIGGREYEARIVEVLSDNDIALLKINAQGLPTVMLGNSDEVQIGDTIYAIGCPVGVCGTVTMGRVANVGVSAKTEEGLILHDLIMTDLTTTHGSSGGPLLNDKGEVIGLATAGIVAQEQATGFGLSIPINQAIPLLRKVPGFNLSQTGRSTTVLSFDEIRQRVGPKTVLIKAEVQRELSEFLPKEVLGIRLQIASSDRWGAIAIGNERFGQVKRAIRLEVEAPIPGLGWLGRGVSDLIRGEPHLYCTTTVIEDSIELGGIPIDLLAVAGLDANSFLEDMKFHDFCSCRSGYSSLSIGGFNYGIHHSHIVLRGVAYFRLGDSLQFEISFDYVDIGGLETKVEKETVVETCLELGTGKRVPCVQTHHNCYINDERVLCPYEVTCEWSASWQVISNSLAFVYKVNCLTGESEHYVYRSRIKFNNFLSDFDKLIKTVLSFALSAIEAVA